jgi:hypothetical protein
VFYKKEWSLSFDSTNKFSETEIINMLEFLIANLSVFFGGRAFQQTVGIPMPWVQAVLHLSPTCSFISMRLLKKNEKKLFPIH